MAAACADAWATEYPTELYLMSGHSCDWRQREGRCSDRSVAIKCAKTCELCGPGRPMPTDLAELNALTTRGAIAPLQFEARDGALYVGSATFDIKGVNWFGSEGEQGVPFGLDKLSIDQIFAFVTHYGTSERAHPPSRRRRRTGCGSQRRARRRQYRFGIGRAPQRRGGRRVA